MPVKVHFNKDGYYKVLDQFNGALDIAAYDHNTKTLMFCGSEDSYDVEGGRFIPIEFILGNEEEI
jgi:hypothetical protein